MTIENQYNPTDNIVTDVPLFIRLLEYAKEDAQTDMDLHQVTENALELMHSGQVLTMKQYDQIVGKTELKENKNMKKQLIAEAGRMQKLAGMLNEEQGYDDINLELDEENAEIFDNEQSEEDLDEMARTAGTGGAYNITPEGEAVLKQVKATKEIPEGLRPSLVAILIFLYKAKKEGKRAQKIDFAKQRGVPQPAINPLFNMLEEKGLISKEGYVSAGKPAAAPKPQADITKDVDALELD